MEWQTVLRESSFWPKSKDYAAAKSRCEGSMGRTVVSIHSSAQMEQVKTACGEGNVCWIGLQQNPREKLESRQWAWTDGTELNFGFDSDGLPVSGDPWQPGQPSLVAGQRDENCVFVSNEEGWDGRWGVAACSGDSNMDIYALCGLCMSTDCVCGECAVDCDGEEFAVWPTETEAPIAVGSGDCAADRDCGRGMECNEDAECVEKYSGGGGGGGGGGRGGRGRGGKGGGEEEEEEEELMAMLYRPGEGDGDVANTINTMNPVLLMALLGSVMALMLIRGVCGCWTQREYKRLDSDEHQTHV